MPERGSWYCNTSTPGDPEGTPRPGAQFEGPSNPIKAHEQENVLQVPQQALQGPKQFPQKLLWLRFKQM